MGIVVDVALFADHFVLSAKGANDRRIGFEHLQALPVGNLLGELACIIDRANHRDIGGLTDRHVVFPKARRQVNDAGALFGPASRIAQRWDEVVPDGLTGVILRTEDLEALEIAASITGASELAEEV